LAELISSPADAGSPCEPQHLHDHCMRVLVIIQAILFLTALGIVLRIRKRFATPTPPSPLRQRVKRGVVTTVWAIILYMVIFRSLLALISD
jgi:hypothetical protein